MKTIQINDRAYRLVAFFDEFDRPTEDHREAVRVLVQDPDDIRPQGEKQRYHSFTLHSPIHTVS